jgi:DNA-directed RNA polymerase subunit N (RpoN/RPB10)
LIDEDVIENILMTLSKCYSEKVSTIEEVYDPNNFTKEHLFGTLTSFEMKKFGKEKKKKAACKATKSEDDLDSEGSKELEEKFTRNLKKGTNKYKVMLPFKCFSCGNIGHYASTFPNKAIHKKRDNKDKNINKNYYVREDAGIFDDDYNFEDDKDECMFLALENKIVSTNHERCTKESGSERKKEEMDGALVS